MLDCHSKEGSSQKAQKAASPSLQDSRSVAVSWPASSKGGTGDRKQIRFGRTFTARRPRRAPRATRQGNRQGSSRGARDRQTLGSATPRKGNGTSKADAEAISRKCPYVVCLVCRKSTGGLGSEKPEPPYVVLRKKDGGSRWTGAWLTNVQSRKVTPAIQRDAISATKLSAALPGVTEGVVSDKRPKTGAHGAQHHAGRPPYNAEGATHRHRRTREDALAGRFFGAQGTQSPSERADQE